MHEGRLHLPTPDHLLNQKSLPFALKFGLMMPKDGQDYGLMHWNNKHEDLLGKDIALLEVASEEAAAMWKGGLEHKPTPPAD